MTFTALTYFFPICNWSVVPCPVLTVASFTCIQISQEAGQVVWYSHLFQNFPQVVVIHIVKGFAIVNKAEIVVFLELSLVLFKIYLITSSNKVYIRMQSWLPWVFSLFFTYYKAHISSFTSFISSDVFFSLLISTYHSISWNVLQIFIFL